MQCYRLKFTAPFHVDSRGNAFYEESSSFIHSDTMSAAILATWALVWPEQITEQARKPSFRLSSAFPYYQDCYFLPRVLSSQAVKLPGERLRDAKKLKKIEWLDSKLWLASLNDPNWAEQLDLEHGLCQGILAGQSAKMPKRLWLEEERPRLAMDRQANQASEGQIFNFSRIWFDEQGGLYFLAVFDDKSSQQQFEMILNVLADSGIGADRSNGNGCFTWQPGEIKGLQLAQHERAIALSLVNPAPSDCQTGWLEDSAYKLVSRGGWVGGSGFRKQRLRMFAEGSVFPKPLQGRMVDVSVDKLPQKVYRDGRGFFVKAG
ncbi:type III-A CRISPR-associated RAMP protein Csm4 [Methylomicrobium sp. Wu6]|uniref:type III-A CRISPR-associated RAMP protein Csm4 n=1 Tax=Methylomicrobium sp. Wu6 TaxID=3107928 RepID=UPI002DD69C6D|nr:type III-A CRISPR-associated RAMP protein Csm4 [Methylomicrobium sp. Wu6]MEC4748354.1 type III-A CRISPR-associated RAMP protein Csm4 [Methylomicrobium sp. Wu6]